MPEWHRTEQNCKVQHFSSDETAVNHILYGRLPVTRRHFIGWAGRDKKFRRNMFSAVMAATNAPSLFLFRTLLQPAMLQSRT